jgi:serine/threonine-protein kinase
MVENEMVLNGRYKLLERVGSGGMSVVYKAQDLLLGRPVAVKMLHESFTGDPDFLRRFRQEAFAAANLQHPNIVTVHDIGQDGNRHYIVMEFVEGQTMKDLVRQYKAQGTVMPGDRALDLLIQTAEGIGYAHRAGLVHCDVKPQNVLVTRDDRIKVADFGIARAVTEASQQINDDRVWGTPQYFSPEQASGEAPTPASDVYSIGVMMFEALTGELPFNATTQAALALKHIQEPPPHVSELNPAVPEQMDLIVDKVLAKEPEGRYRTAGQLARVLTSYRDTSQADTGPFQTPWAVGEVTTAGETTQIYPFQGQTVADGEGQTAVSAEASAADQGTDWLAIGLGFMALVFMLGLIPLWYFVYTAYAG